MRRVILRDARKADFEALLAEPLPYRTRAFAAERDGELLGIGGLIFQPQDIVAAFVLLRPGAARYKVALHKAGKRTMAEARRLGISRVVALAEKGNPAAEPWLMRLGFKRKTVRGESVWLWQDQE